MNFECSEKYRWPLNEFGRETCCILCLAVFAFSFLPCKGCTSLYKSQKDFCENTDDCKVRHLELLVKPADHHCKYRKIRCLQNKPSHMICDTLIKADFPFSSFQHEEVQLSLNHPWSLNHLVS